MKARNLTGLLGVVTGAGSGIGRAIALELAARGADLALNDVNPDGLEQTAERAQALGRQVLTQRVDVSRRDEMHAFAERVLAERGAPGILVNNAGVALSARFVETPLEDWDWIVGINLMGVVHGCHFFVPHMIERGAPGHVVNVASMAGFTPAEELSAYCTTKSAVIGLSESLRVELARHRIGVTAVCPGLIDTPIVHAARRLGAYGEAGRPERDAKLFQRRGYPPEKVAKNVMRAIETNTPVAPIAPEAWAAYLLKRTSPRAISRLSQWVSTRFGPGDGNAH